MSENMAISPLAFAPRTGLETGIETRLPASPASVARFEQLLYVPPKTAEATQAAGQTLSVESAGMRDYLAKLSERWNAGQDTLQRMTDRGEFSSRELVLAQIQMVNCALDMEVSSKCAGMFENGVQTLIQRGG
jgi:hypothetical protein